MEEEQIYSWCHLEGIILCLHEFLFIKLSQAFFLCETCWRKVRESLIHEKIVRIQVFQIFFSILKDEYCEQ